jgi:energy-converting hydrogenase Eha subunit B
MVNNVIGVVNYVIAARPSLLNFVIADTWHFAGKFQT